MFKIKQYCLLIFIASSQLVFAQRHKQSDNTNSVYIIPFHLTSYNNLSVPAILNGKDSLNLMFHTAANALTLTEETIKRLNDLSFSGVDTVKSWGGSDNESRFSKNNILQIGSLKWEGQSIWENKNSGQETDGKFGTDLFENKVIELDFEENVMRISNNLPGKIKKYQKLKLSFENDYMFIEAGFKIADLTLNNKFLIHSGYSGALLFDDKFVAENKLDQKLKIVDEKQLKDSYGNILKTQKAVLPLLSIGNMNLPNVPVSFFTGGIGRQKMSIIGGDVLKRFNIIIDANRTFIYLKANKLKTLNYSNI